MGKPCTHQCCCVSCNNPNGAHIPMNKSVDGRVKRKHAFQVELPHSKNFSKDRGEDITLGVWSAFEAIVLEEVCSNATMTW